MQCHIIHPVKVCTLDGYGSPYELYVLNSWANCKEEATTIFQKNYEWQHFLNAIKAVSNQLPASEENPIHLKIGQSESVYKS